MTLTLLEWFMLAALFTVSTMLICDALNSLTAAVRELIQIVRKDKP